MAYRLTAMSTPIKCGIGRGEILEGNVAISLRDLSLCFRKTETVATGAGLSGGDAVGAFDDQEAGIPALRAVWHLERHFQ